MKILIALSLLFCSSAMADIIPDLTCEVNTINYDGTIHHETVNTHDNTFSDFSIVDGQWNFVELNKAGWPILSIYIPIGTLEGNAYTRDSNGEILGTGKVLCDWK